MEQLDQTLTRVVLWEKIGSKDTSFVESKGRKYTDNISKNYIEKCITVAQRLIYYSIFDDVLE